MTDFHSPDFSDRQAHLREAMRRDTDPRWNLMPVEDPSIPRRRLYAPEILAGVSAVVCLGVVLFFTKW